MHIRKIVGPILTLLLLISLSFAIKSSVHEQQVGRRTNIRILTDSDKEQFLQDAGLNQALASHGFSITFEKAGAREIPTRPDLNDFDIAFVAGDQAAAKTQGAAASRRVFPFCYTPVAIASWRQLIPVLEQSGLVSQKDGTDFLLDMRKLLALMEKGERWKDLPGNSVYSVGKSVLITSTDVRISNSGALYLALASYLANGNNVVDSDADARKVAAQMVTLFSRQGFQESSSAGPFEDYTAMGIGKAPLAMIYEQQFLEYVFSHPNPNPDMVLLYPEPTIFSKHALVALTGDGVRFAQAMTSDPRISLIAQRYGFRTADSSALFAAAAAKKLAIPHTIVDVIDPPSYPILEKLITDVDSGLGQ